MSTYFVCTQITLGECTVWTEQSTAVLSSSDLAIAFSTGFGAMCMAWLGGFSISIVLKAIRLI